MEDGLDFDSLFDSINLTGQWQPSSLPATPDASSLNSQILDDIVLSADDVSSHINSSNDDISNALIDTAMDQFLLDDISKFIATPMGELPQTSTIEETLERININTTQTDILSSAICVQMGSSPVEQKEIDNFILAKPNVRQQQRINKNAKSRRVSGSHQPSSTVGPIDVLSSRGGCQPCTTAPMQYDYDKTDELLQFDTMESKQIQILGQPRANFRPRTFNESKTASHFIRCEGNSQYEYPTIAIPFTWARQSIKNIIEVTLLAKDGEPHDYTIDNKTCSASFDDAALIFRQNTLHTLYFCVTNDDFKTGHKSFMIEYIKPKQEGNITKELIKNRQLDQSLFRFTRIYQTDKNTFERDENSVGYSCLMTESYGDVGVEHMGPKFGPICGNERVYALLKGHFAKDDLTVIVTEDMTGWQQQVPVTKSAQLVNFFMPPYPYSQFDRALTNITIYYKGEELCQSPYLYKGSLDQELAGLNLNDSSSSSSSTTNSFNAIDFFQATGVCPVINPSRKSSTAKRTKRLNKK